VAILEADRIVSSKVPGASSGKEDACFLKLVHRRGTIVQSVCFETISENRLIAQSALNNIHSISTYELTEEV
jgi:hypothetical protein